MVGKEFDISYNISAFPTEADPSGCAGRNDKINDSSGCHSGRF